MYCMLLAGMFGGKSWANLVNHVIRQTETILATAWLGLSIQQILKLHNGKFANLSCMTPSNLFSAIQ